MLFSPDSMLLASFGPISTKKLLKLLAILFLSFIISFSYE